MNLLLKAFGYDQVSKLLENEFASHVAEHGLSYATK